MLCKDLAFSIAAARGIIKINPGCCSPAAVRFG